MMKAVALLTGPRKASRGQESVSCCVLSVSKKRILTCMEASDVFLRKNAEKENLNQYWYSRVFDLDSAFAKDPGFVKYDFNTPEAIPLELHGIFDLVVIDPPFITREVWEKYAAAAKLLLRPSSKEAAHHVARDTQSGDKAETPMRAAADDSGAEKNEPAAAANGGEGIAPESGARLDIATCGRVLCSTIAENRELMLELFGAKAVPFQPSIPHLVYQYDLYANYHTHALTRPNPELL